MKRFSQHNSLVTLNEINITPLLDLAFVLLIIFVITRPMLEQQLPLQLPQNMGKPDSQNIDPRDVRRVEITPNGVYWLRGQHLSRAQIESELVLAHRSDPKLIVYVAGDARTAWDNVAAVFDICDRNKIQVAFKSTPAQHP
ncbi:MAG TPA: biopolymer transporter ExbD [Verrucomicrobiae bacterium]|jgi:biopolymer transport protein ExbD|nr:biopolymer transporter ExbD [Verrucomicrobiae bacterium]